MKIAVILGVSLMASLAFASNYDQALKNAKDFLNVEVVTLEDESQKSYFFVTELEYDEDDLTEDYPCFRGVVVDKASSLVVAPKSDPQIKLTYAYSDTHIQGNVVINCAD